MDLQSRLELIRAKANRKPVVMAEKPRGLHASANPQEGAKSRGKWREQPRGKRCGGQFGILIGPAHRRMKWIEEKEEFRADWKPKRLRGTHPLTRIAYSLKRNWQG